MDFSVDTAPCGVAVFADDGTIIDVNATLCDMLGTTRVALTGWHIDKIFPPGARIFYQTHVFPLLRLRGRVEEIYVALRDASGRDIPVLFNAVRREGEGRALIEAIFVRMLQRHEFEDQLLQARRLAEEANAAKSRFLSMMSHDLRTPLTAIKGNADLLQGRFLGTLTPRQMESAVSISIAAGVLSQMIDDILEFARLEAQEVSVNLGEVGVGDAVARAASLVRVHLESSGLRLAIASCSDELVAMADADRLQQILLNLLTNAAKFTPSGGTIEILCEPIDSMVAIHVRDSGVGIAPDDHERIFAPFVQLPTSMRRSNAAPAGGVGLGLAISRDLSRAMGGDVTVRSEPGAGSVFTIVLPAADSTVRRPLTTA